MQIKNKIYIVWNAVLSSLHYENIPLKVETMGLFNISISDTSLIIISINLQIFLPKKVLANDWKLLINKIYNWQVFFINTWLLSRLLASRHSLPRLNVCCCLIGQFWKFKTPKISFSAYFSRFSCYYSEEILKSIKNTSFIYIYLLFAFRGWSRHSRPLFTINQQPSSNWLVEDFTSLCILQKHVHVNDDGICGWFILI